MSNLRFTASYFAGTRLCPYDSQGFILHLWVALNNITFVICILQQLCGTDLNIYIYTFSIVKELDCKDQNVNTVHTFSFDPSKCTSLNVCSRLYFRYFSQSLTDKWSETGQNASLVKLNENVIAVCVLHKQEGLTVLAVWLQCFKKSAALSRYSLNNSSFTAILPWPVPLFINCIVKTFHVIKFNI